MSRPQPLIDVRKSLYDSEGYRHTLVQATPVQIITLLEGQYWLWDRVSGRCLVEGLPGLVLTNDRPEREDVRARRQPVAETRAFLLAQRALQAAARSSMHALSTADAPEALACDPTHAAMQRDGEDLADLCVHAPARPAAEDESLAPTLGAALALGLLGLALLWPAPPQR